MLFAEALRSLRASASTTLAATMTVLIGMFLLGLFIALGSWVVSWSDHVKKEVVVRVFFCTRMSCGYDASTQQINAVATKLRSDPHVKDFSFVSRDEALKRMQKRMPQVFKVGLPSNPLPASEEVVPKRAEYAQAIYASFTPHSQGVESISYGQKVAKRILSVAKVIESIFLLAVIILLVASTLLIANTIRLSIFSRRREIEVMKLVGATNWFVRGPFMIEGLLCGLGGSLAAVILLVIGKSALLPAIGIGHSKDAHAMAFELNALILIGIGLTLGLFGTGLTLRRFLQV
jgi:cell division transport system permease protein